MYHSYSENASKHANGATDDQNDTDMIQPGMARKRHNLQIWFHFRVPVKLYPSC